MSDQLSQIENDRRRRRRWPWVVAASAVAVALVGTGAAAFLGGDEDPTPTATGTAPTEPVRGGTLQFALIDYQHVVDVQAGSSYAESIIGGNVVDKLTWQDPDTGEITPWLATSWDINDDLTEFTFHLRDDVTFSDGTPFDAEVVRANFEQYVHGDEALQIKPNGATLLPNYVETRVVDPRTVTVVFSKPSASFLQASSFTANFQPGFLSLSTLAKSAEERTDPLNVIGTGPFVYESWTPQVSTVLVKRKGYDWAPPALKHKGEAYLDKIVFSSVPEASVRTGSLESGEVDATLDVQTTDEAPLRDKGFVVESGRVRGADIRFDFNVGLFPTDDLAVRQAIQLGWNRDTVAKNVLTDSYEISTSVVARAVDGWVDYSGTLLHQDTKKAEKLLDDAGWVPGPDGIRVKDGKPLVVKLSGISNLVVNKPAYESIQQDLRKLGIDLQLTVVPIADYTANNAKAKTDFNITAANRSRADISVLNIAYNPTLGNANYVPDGFEGRQEIVDTLSALETTLDPDERHAAAKKAQDLILEKYALTNPVYTPAQVIAHSPKVHGILFDAQARNPFVNTWKED
ncbi:ABC transporter substrate-binding protein [Cellulomonas chitinilytica]|uniref:ABC transporter substrate-binding protein n=1 Tax=Cellulomonas chitinilytica TaxID=398759 RepID=A0A919NYH7_9CELL|nr:ABC transporter substrate-binding protein [Cellulomonas chitinilytica]GIG19976.1 ABC transporter substrate-binding protein [Cellulomonas chitinilytica]